MTPAPSNVLAARYASESMRAIWGEEGRIVQERRLWVAVLKAQRDLGLAIPDAAVTAYEAVETQVNLASIQAREAVLRHDVKSRIEEFCDLAGWQLIHQGMTSRDLTDNVEQAQILHSLRLVRTKYVAVLGRLSSRSRQWRDLLVVGRTHHAAAQLTTLGKRLAMFGEEMLQALDRLDSLIQRYPLRGLKGAVGTALDPLTLLDGRPEQVEVLQRKVREYLGFGAELNAVGQVYPRSLDFDVVSCLYQLGSGVANLARTLRLMAGAELATEGFRPGQVGSSAMPHKMNTRNTERINGLQVVLGGYVHMLGGLAGDQWFEGDVSCSVVRRVALPDAFFALDGLLETGLHVLADMGVFEAVIQAEVERFLPYLTTTTLLMEAVRRGAGREEAHEAIKEHAVASVLAARNGTPGLSLVDRLAADPRFPMTSEEIQAVLSQGAEFVGLAGRQVDRFNEQVETLLNGCPEATTMKPGRLL